MSRPSRSILRGTVVATTGLAVALVPVATLASSTPASAATPAASPASCSTGALPTDVQGRPAVFTKGLPTGAWVWHDASGFHLRVTHAAKSKLTFTGTIASSGKLTAKRIRAEEHDVLWRKNNGNAVKFTLRNYGGVDGIDFKTGCAKTVKLTLKAAGQKLTTAQVFLGADAVNPAANPVVVQRGPATQPTCATGALPADVLGRPAGFNAGLPAGAWVWHDATGFHLRVTHDSKAKLAFTGTIASSGKITGHRIRAEKNDVIWRNNKNTAIRFTLRNYGAVDGIDFTTNCAKSVTLTLKAAGTALPVTAVHLGSAGTNPTANPVVLTRTVPATAS